MRSKFLLAGILLGTFLLYLPVVHFSPVFDDQSIIVENARLQAWHYVPGYFTEHFFADIPGTSVVYYRPLVMLWFRLVYALLGTPCAHWHLFSILAYLLSTACVYLLIHRLTENCKGALLAAAFFAVYPVHAEAVAWLSSSCDLLLTIFAVMSVYFYAGKKGPISTLSILFAGLAMLSKETGVVVPVLILAYEWIHSNYKKAFSSLPPYLGVTLLYIVLRLNALGGFLSGTRPALSVQAMILTWPRLLATYAMHLVWPVHLSACYDVPIETSIGPLLMLVVVAASLGWIIRGGSSNLRFGAVWFAVSLLPALAIRYITWNDYTHDRYLYLPSVGLALIAAEWLSRIRFTLPRTVLICMVAGALCWGTLLNQRIWRNNIALFTRATETAPENPMAKNNLASAYLDAHREADAFPLLQQLLQKYPAYISANQNMARYYSQTGNLAEAERYSEIADALQKYQAR